MSWGANESLFCHSSINRSCFSVVYDTSTSVHTWQVASVKGMRGAHAAETCMCTMNALNTMKDLSKVSNGPTNSEYYLLICVGDFRTIHRFTSVGVSAGRFSVSIRKRDIFVVFEFEKKKKRSFSSFWFSIFLSLHLSSAFSILCSYWKLLSLLLLVFNLLCHFSLLSPLSISLIIGVLFVSRRQEGFTHHGQGRDAWGGQ